jgi:uncharacterized secreted repeat protein (TIGR03808 family)
VRGNAASNIQITGNTATELGEVAIYSEFGFEGAVIANNTIDGAALGIVTCNFNEGGRLAVVQGNMIRNLKAKRPIGTAPDDAGGVRHRIEADASVTGNVIENAPGRRHHGRLGRLHARRFGDRQCGAQFAARLSRSRSSTGRAPAVITGNLISGASRGRSSAWITPRR